MPTNPNPTTRAQSPRSGQASKKLLADWATFITAGLSLVIAGVTLAISWGTNGHRLDVLEEKTKNLPETLQEIKDNLKLSTDLQEKVNKVLMDQYKLEVEVDNLKSKPKDK